MTGEHRPEAVAARPDPAVFRDVVGRLTSGVTVITARHEGIDYGMTASAVVSLSLEPPMMLACVNRKLPTRVAISESRAFAVNILTEDQAHLAERFATPRADKFEGVEVVHGQLGVPLLSDALAHLECRVVEDVRGGTHSVFLASVDRAIAREGSPLAYFRGRFGRLDFVQDEAAYAGLRQRVLDRALPLNESLEIIDLADELGLPPSAVHHGLTKLTAEGLLRRDPAGGYVIAPLDGAASDRAVDAKAAIESGVAALTVRSVTREQLTELRARMAATLPLIDAGRFVDLDRYLAANAAFHEYQVGLAGNESLLEAYRRLSVTGVMARALTGNDAAPEELTADHRRLVEAYEQHDLAHALAAIARHCERSKAIQRRGIELAGGVI